MKVLRVLVSRMGVIAGVSIAGAALSAHDGATWLKAAGAALFFWCYPDILRWCDEPVTVADQGQASHAKEGT